jgi:hypothetical protein
MRSLPVPFAAIPDRASADGPTIQLLYKIWETPAAICPRGSRWVLQGPLEAAYCVDRDRFVRGSL